MTVTYGLAPSFNITQDLDLELPEAEDLWEASTAEQWMDLRTMRGDVSLMSIRDAMTEIVFGNGTSIPVHGDGKGWSSLATIIVMHSVNIHMWNIMQFTQSFTTFVIDGQKNTDIRGPLVCQVESSLTRCYALLTASRSELERSSDDSDGPILFNCLALLRISYMRVFTGVDSIDRIILLSQDPDQVASSIKSYVTCVQERRPLLLQAVMKAYDGMLSTFKPGYFVVRKTAALSWSVEHAIAMWDCCMFSTLAASCFELRINNLSRSTFCN